MGQQPHSIEAMAVLQSQQSSAKGLTQEEARTRLEMVGSNELKEERRASPFELFLGQFKSFLVAILLFASVVSFALGEVADGVIILVIIILNAILGFVQEYRAEKAIEALKKLAAPKARVVRDGSEALIPAREVVPGDILVFEAGDIVAADARLIEAFNLKIDESVLTGESVPSTKVVAALPEDAPLADRENMAYSGTAASYGRGKGVVVGTGMQTEFGKIAARIQQTKDEQTPLQRRLESLGKILGVLVIGIAVLLFAVEALSGEPLLDSFMIAVALAVSAIPEGLTAVVTVALALGVRRMSRNNAIVRRLASVETLGSTTVICTDKTGTLTKDEMTVKAVAVGGRPLEVTGTGYAPEGQFLSAGQAIEPQGDGDLSLLLRIGCLCNHAALHKNGSWDIVGDPTEGALLTLAAKAGLWSEALLQQYPLVAEVPFDSSRKRMSTIHDVNGQWVAHVKGAPEMLLDCCSLIRRDGQAVPITTEDKENALGAVKKMATGAMRVLAMAYREVPVDVEPVPDQVEKDLIYVGLAGMIDPARPEVREAIAQCKKAGIRPVIITGDHELTAQAIARDIGMLDGSGRVLTGADLDRMSKEDLMAAAAEVSVYARTSPEHKAQILEALRRGGQVVVAMTGDGVNDAPAIKAADIGIAMGIKGTDVTREASDMVLADDNFATIVKAIEEGRAIYDNIRKFIRLLLSTNLDEMLLVATATLLRLPLPMLPIQVLWINVVSDGLPALALSVDPREKDIMERKPRNPKEGIFHGMLWFIVAAALVDYAVETLLLLYWKNTSFVSIERLRTIIFTSTIIFELFFVFNCRSEKHSIFRNNPFSNKPLVLASITSLLLQIAVIYVPSLQALFKTVPLTASDWLLVVAMGASGLLVLPEVFMR